MPVTFKTDALIAAAKEALSGHDKADKIYQAECDAYRADKIADQDKLPQLRELRDELSAFLKLKRQPTRDDARRFKAAAREDYLSHLFVQGLSDIDVRNNVSRPAGWLVSAKVASYQGLIKLLEAHTDDTITANQLKLLGYDNLEMLFRLAAMHSPITDD
jgi:hypothetical protein